MCMPIVNVVIQQTSLRRSLCGCRLRLKVFYVTLHVVQGVKLVNKSPKIYLLIPSMKQWQQSQSISSQSILIKFN